MQPQDKVKSQLPDHIEEFFVSRQQPKEVVISRELFDATEKDVDLKTQLTEKQIMILVVPYEYNKVLEKYGLKPVYSDFINRFLRLKVSQDRASRKEYVDVNRRDRFEEHLNKFNSFKNLIGDKNA